jgi:hypothetical protein
MKVFIKKYPNFYAHKFFKENRCEIIYVSLPVLKTTQRTTKVIVKSKPRNDHAANEKTFRKIGRNHKVSNEEANLFSRKEFSLEFLNEISPEVYLYLSGC